MNNLTPFDGEVLSVVNQDKDTDSSICWNLGIGMDNKEAVQKVLNSLERLTVAGLIRTVKHVCIGGTIGRRFLINKG